MENTKTTFLLPEDLTILDVIFEILKNNNLEETESEMVKKVSQNQPSNFIIVREIASSLAGKKVSEKDASLGLQEQLKITDGTAKKIISDINQKLMPYAKTINFVQEENKKIQISEKKFYAKEKSFDELLPIPKRRSTQPQEEIIQPISKPAQRSGPDNYREPIE